MPHYPEQRYASRLTIIRREVLLPEESTGAVTVEEGKRVDIRDVVAQGVKPSKRRILDVKTFFGIRKASEAEKLILVEVGDVVDDVQPLAGKSATRGKRLFSPVKGIISGIDNGRIILQEMPEITDLEAGVRGRVSQILPGRGAIIETQGAQIQGVWGNDQRTIATLRVEPDEGVENIYTDQLDMKYTGAMLVSRRPIKALTISVMEEQDFAGIIAPSMDYSLRETALKANGVIFLTEGFGTARMSRAILNLLGEFEGQQVTVDAYEPRPWETRRPEIIVNVAGTKGGEAPSRPNMMLALRTGMTVRITRDPYAGQTGRIVDLPKSPVLLENGLRILSAQLELPGGETIYVPLQNLEVLGR
jgi:transcription antitermination factor NusG